MSDTIYETFVSRSLYDAEIERNARLERDLAAARAERDQWFECAAMLLAGRRHGTPASSLERELVAAAIKRDQWREVAEALRLDLEMLGAHTGYTQAEKRFDALKAQEAGK